MKIEKVLVTPEMAKKFLEHQQNVRPPSRPTVARYVRDILAGDWTLTAHGLAFDQQGRMRDGQHRCIAVIKANRAVWFWAHLDCTEDEVARIDIGRPRSLVHVMYPNGDRVHRRGLQCTRFIARVETHNKGGNLSPAHAFKITQRLGHEAVHAICAPACGRITAATRTAFVLAYPLKPTFIDNLWQHIMARDQNLGDVSPALRQTFEALVPVTAAPIRESGGMKADSALALFYRICVGVHACLTGKALQVLKASDSGFRGILKMRERDGLPTTFLSDSNWLAEPAAADSERQAAQ